ncbi:MAG: cell division protein ZapA [Clostridia bacterium]|nr:cell division protein ZapA [Clostridia bacterium]
MEKKKTVVNLAGQEFRISSGSDEEYMQALAASVNRRVALVRAQYPDQSTSRCALLAMLEMADEIAKLREESAQVDRKITELRNLRDSESKVQAPVKRPFERKKPVGV